jgi:cytoskeleton protein RodZ
LQDAAPAPAASTAVLPTGAAPAGAVAEAAMPTGPTLVFVFEDRSWLEVMDASKQIIHTGENPGGSRLTLTGKPPFDIVVGNAGKVKLSYGERSIDLAPHTRAEVARLKLEE